MDGQEPNMWTVGIGAVTAVGGAVAGWYSKRRSEQREERADDQTEQNVQIIQRDRLLEIVNSELVEPLRQEVKEVRERLEKAESRNTSLLAYVYRLIAVLRRNHLEHEIPEPPDGIEL